ncbi:uncharacterized protein SPPG_01672 [Spizellomyces punctatus DAOM BR117]|uniref:Cytochrome c oxidase subunit VIa n=1 Tax=Spizellomyces punctatus (strain DAOM BR117) TaxID=645134 RepID=A0A0L0HSA8_SPIPD|nr:uncharacterized protein SPPG_01672 [Spizellomyces punctatus DAOM BR117]KND04241.1 hypothetical protein SPPG_01672 [Spizellomyces punctatus DAOM BR117]|eukprot:XP_016612280.1 hypothetical protein SPPG_01672 [Spizellomyces punctatus DAOM BR117]
MAIRALSAIVKAITPPVEVPVPVYRKDLPPIEECMLPESLMARKHAAHAVQTWKKFNLYFTAPVLLLVTFFTIPKEIAHIRHLQEHPKEWQNFVYMRKRKNAYPWGNSNLFYYPNANPKPPEEEDEGNE